MKTKFIALLFALSLFPLYSNAQLDLGIRTGYGQSWQNYGDDFPVDGSTLKIDGFEVALTAYKPLSRHLSVGIEPGFARRGAACEPGFVWNNIFVVQDATLNANYLQAPVLVQGHFELWQGKLSLLPKLGGGVSYMVSGYRDVVFIDAERPQERQPIDFSQQNLDVSRWDIGLHGGLGIGLPVGPGQLLIEGRYYHGIGDVSNQLTSENRSWTAGIGYTISL